MMARLHSILKSSFVRSVATLSSGQMITTAIPILAAPVLGRLYLPNEYGVLAAYMSIASVLSAIGNWQYAQGIIVERYNNKAEVLLRLCMLTSAATALLALLIAVIITVYPPSESPEWQQIRFWILLLPASTYIGGVTAARMAMANRQQMYRQMAIIAIISVSLTVITSIIMGIAKYGYIGLMVSYFLGQLITFSLYGYVISKRQRVQLTVSNRRMLTLARKHKEFAFFTTPTAFIGNFAMQSPIYILGLMGATEMIGLFSRARQLLGMPIALLGGSISTVFQRRAAADYASEGNCRKVYVRTFFVLAGVGLVPTILLAIWAPDLFEIFLGPNWRAAGDLSRVLAPMLLLQLISSPLSTIFYIVGAQREDFSFTIIMTALTCIAVSVPMMLDWQFSVNS